MPDFSLSRYTQFICITSITLLLWGLITGVIKPTFEAWFAFGFFSVLSFLLAIILYNRD
jgi:hypothetical protein